MEREEFMNIFFLMIPVSLSIACLFIYLYILAVKQGQYDDLDSPPVRAILDNTETLEDAKETYNYEQSKT